eukprot:748002-Hanusia_phi.AAC.1
MRGRAEENLMRMETMKVLVLMLLLAVVGGGSRGGEDTLCGDCRELEVLVKRMSGDEIERKAAGHHGQGNIRGAGRILCAGFCSGTLLSGRWGGAASNLGVVMKEMGLLELAERCYILASRLDPASPSHAYRRSRRFLGLGGSSQGQADDVTGFAAADVGQAFLHATRLWPGYGDAYNNLGNCLMSMSRFEEAAASYAHAIRTNPKEANYYVNMGESPARLRRQAVRLMHRRSVCEEEPDRRDPLPGAGARAESPLPRGLQQSRQLQARRGRLQLEGAVSAYKDAMKLMPDSGDIMVNMASAKAYLCDWKNRKSFLKRIIEVSRRELKGKEPHQVPCYLEILVDAEGKKLSLSTFYANIFGVDLELLRKVAEYHANSAMATVRYLLPIQPWYLEVVRGGLCLSLPKVHSDCSRGRAENRFPFFGSDESHRGPWHSGAAPPVEREGSHDLLLCSLVLRRLWSSAADRGELGADRHP